MKLEEDSFFGTDEHTIVTKHTRFMIRGRDTTLCLGEK